MTTNSFSPISLDQVADRLEHLLLRHEELQKSHALLQQQLDATTAERDALRTRLTAARTRIDTLLARIPPDSAPAAQPPAAALTIIPTLTEPAQPVPVHAAAPAPAPASSHTIDSAAPSVVADGVEGIQHSTMTQQRAPHHTPQDAWGALWQTALPQPPQQEQP